MIVNGTEYRWEGPADKGAWRKIVGGESIFVYYQDVLTALAAAEEKVDVLRLKCKRLGEVADGKQGHIDAMTSAIISALSAATDYERLPISKLNYLQGIRKTVEQNAKLIECVRYYRDHQNPGYHRAAETLKEIEGTITT